MQFADWAAPIVPTLKSDKASIQILRCDFNQVTVNQASKLDQYPISKMEDLFATIGGKKTFPKLDMSHAYQQLKLDEDSNHYVVINTHEVILYLGLLTCYGQFLPDLSTALAPLDDLLKKDIKWKWAKSEGTAIKNSKDLYNVVTSFGSVWSFKRIDFVLRYIDLHMGLVLCQHTKWKMHRAINWVCVPQLDTSRKELCANQKGRIGMYVWRKETSLLSFPATFYAGY